MSEKLSLERKNFLLGWKDEIGRKIHEKDIKVVEATNLPTEIDALWKQYHALEDLLEEGK